MADLTPEPAGSNVSPLGWLEQTPASWLHQLVGSLPPEDKLSVFQCCGLLAKQVVTNAPCTQLQLLEEPAKDQVEQRRSTLTQLLDGCKRLRLRVLPSVQQPLPTKCSPLVVALTIESSKKPARHCIQWAALTNLQRVKWQGECVCSEDIHDLCDAVEAGKVPLLTIFEAPACNKLPTPDCVARVLGPQLKHVTTTSRALLQQLDQFTALHSLRIEDCYLSADLARKICAHPTLRMVTFAGDCGITGDHSQSKCGWETLVLSDASPDILSHLPLSGLKELRFVGSIFACSEADRAALTHVFINHRKKVAYEPARTAPDASSFTLYCPCENLVQPLQQIMGVGKFILQGGVLNPQVIPALWQSLPHCLHTVCWVGMYGKVNWPNVWQGLPEHITQFELVKCDMVAQDVCAWLEAAPRHVKNIVIRHYHTFIQQWEDAGVQKAAPAHVTLSLAVEPLAVL